MYPKVLLRTTPVTWLGQGISTPRPKTLMMLRGKATRSFTLAFVHGTLTLVFKITPAWTDQEATLFEFEKLRSMYPASPKARTSILSFPTLPKPTSNHSPT
jgi:hypothetical protein